MASIVELDWQTVQHDHFGGMMKYLLKMILLTLLLMLMVVQTVAQSPTFNFVYYTQDEEAGTSNLYLMDTATFEKVVLQTPLIEYIALAPSRFIAYSDLDNWMYVLDLQTQTTHALELQLVVHLEVIYDSHTFLSGSMYWSPNGEQLAYVAQDAEGVVGIYRYSTLDNSIQKLSGSRVFKRGVADIASWSPDGKWLSVLGAWDFSVERWEIDLALLSADGTHWVDLESDQRLCRVVWSPDMRHLLSEQSCYASSIWSLPITLIEFDSELLTLRDVSARLETDTLENHFVSRSHPTWIDNETVRYVRYLIPISHEYGTRFVMQIIEGNLVKGDYTILHKEVDLTWQDFIDTRILIHTTSDQYESVVAYDLYNNRLLPTYIGSGSMGIGVVVSTSANLIFGCDGCTNTPGGRIFYFFDLETAEVIYSNRFDIPNPIRPVGFISRSEQ